MQFALGKDLQVHNHTAGLPLHHTYVFLSVLQLAPHQTADMAVVSVCAGIWQPHQEMLPGNGSAVDLNLEQQKKRSGLAMQVGY